MKRHGIARPLLTALALLAVSCGENALQNPAQPQLPATDPKAAAAAAARKGKRLGSATVGVFRASEMKFLLRNTNAAGEPDVTAAFGEKGDLPVVGDWDGNGTVTVGVYRPSQATFLLRNANSGGAPDASVQLGGATATDVPVTGDWDSTGTDTVGLFRPAEPVSVFLLRNTNATGPVEVFIKFGEKDDVPLAGNWDGK